MVKNPLKTGTNSKLGKSIASFNLPPITTCPGRTKLCESFCYATKGFYGFSSVKKSLGDSKTKAEDSGFVTAVNGQLARSRKTKAVRIHAAGDFYSVKYVEAWTAIAKANPEVRFWAYTRSWRLAKFLPSLKALSDLPNVQVWASMDDELRGQETPPAWLRIADVQDTWDGVDSSYVKCPNQKNDTITCESCSYCFKPAGKRKRNVIFKIH